MVKIRPGPEDAKILVEAGYMRARGLVDYMATSEKRKANDFNSDESNKAKRLDYSTQYEEMENRVTDVPGTSQHHFSANGKTHGTFCNCMIALTVMQP